MKGVSIMLTFERVLETFADYLSEDKDTEVVEAKHGYIVMFWHDQRAEYDFFTLCKTPHALLKELLKSYGSYLAWVECGPNGDPNTKQKAEIAKKKKALREKCRDADAQ